MHEQRCFDKASGEGRMANPERCFALLFDCGQRAATSLQHVKSHGGASGTSKSQ